MFDEEESIIDRWNSEAVQSSFKGTNKTISMNPLTSGTTLNEFVSTWGKSPQKDH